MKQKVNSNPDRIVIKQKRGTWLRFIKLFPKCRLPFAWVIAYIIIDVVSIHTGITETDYTARLFSGDTSSSTVTYLITFIIINIIVTNLTVFMRQLTSARINRNMRGVVLEKVMHLPMSFFKDEEPSDAIYRIVRNSEVIDSTIMMFALPLAMAAYQSIAIFRRVFNYDWRLSVILIAFIPVFIFIAFIFGRINYSLSERDASINSGLMQRLSELVVNIPLAKAFAREDRQAEAGEALTERLYKLNIKSSWLGQLQDFSESAFTLVQSLIILIVGMVLLRNESIDTRAWVTFYMFSSLFTGAISEFMMYWSNVKIIQGSADRVAEIMNAPEEDLSGEACTELSGDITIEDLSFGYDESKRVLENVNGVFRDNTATALLGRSGCGKTTLANLINRLYEPDNGCIRIGGKNIRDYALDEYRSHFVMVSQNTMLFSGTVRENVCYGNGAVSEEAIENALKKAGAYDFVMEMRGGLDAVIEEYGSNLSGGQRQRLSVARALLSDAHYIILDEPVSAMDALATAELLDVFKALAEDHCMIVIAHTPAILTLVEDAVVIEDGQITASGSIDELRKSNRFVIDFFGKGGEADA